MNRKELITSLRVSQLQSFKENRGLIPEFYGGGFGFLTSPEEQQKQNIEKRKKELEAKQIQQTGKKIEYQEPTPPSSNQTNQVTNQTPESKVATDSISSFQRSVFPLGTRSDAEEFLDTPEGRSFVQNEIRKRVASKYPEAPGGDESAKNIRQEKIDKESEDLIKRGNWDVSLTSGARQSAEALDRMGDRLNDEVRAGRMTGAEAAKQLNSAAKQYQERANEKFTQDMLKQAENAAWTGADIAGTALSFASGVGAPAAAVSATSKAAKAAEAVRRVVNTGGPLTGAGVDLATAGTAKLNQALTTDKQEQEKYSDIASQAALRAGATTVAVGAFKAVPLIGQGIGKVAAPVTPKIIKEPVRKVSETTGKLLDKTFSGDVPSQIAGGLIGYQQGSKVGGAIGGAVGGILGSVAAGHLGSLATKVAPILNKSVRDLVPRVK